MSNLNDLLKSYKDCAGIIENYKELSKTELANGYCDYDELYTAAKERGDEIEATECDRLRSAYYAALMIRYWYKIFEWIQNSASLHLEPTDFVDWLADSLYVAFYYRVWRYEYEAVVKYGKFIDWKYDENGDKILNKYYYVNDETAPDKIINRCCGSMRGRVYQYNNHDKRKLNVQSASLDKMNEDIGDAAEEYIDDGNYYRIDEQSGAAILVKMLLKRDELLEALIVDGIANQDPFKMKENEETHQKQNMFDPRKLVKHLSTVDDIYMYDFCRLYEISPDEGNKILCKLKATSNPKLYKLIEKTKVEIAQTPELLECLIA